MYGGSQAHLLRADDGCLYVVKFVNNPQHRRILANEWLGAFLARALGLPVAPAAIINVPAALVAHSPGLVLQIGGVLEDCASGPQFGSRLISNDGSDPTYTHLRDAGLAAIENLEDFAGIVVFDKWTCNCDQRQMMFHRPAPDRAIRAYMVDQGLCFNGGEWDFPDSPLLGAYYNCSVYAAVTGRESFQPWLERMAGIDEEAVYAAGEEAPPEWYGSRQSLRQLLQRLIRRRARVDGLAAAMGTAPRNPFQNWKKPVASEPKRRSQAA